ncbi:MAG: hypothetical protein BWY21_00357 [Parcubacteria group bacterium ADurb.Bin216]|nr:MAG: hypothetical protein BWY21_00357 [Parcubacteria group bacterium ADurb.Bin216]
MFGLESITNAIGGVVDFVGDLFGGGETAVPNVDPGQKGGGLFGDTNFYSSLISAGTQLAGIYFKQTGDKELAEEAAKQRMKELAFAASQAKGGGGGGGGGSAKTAALASMYQNWAALAQQGGELQSQRAIETGRLMSEPIIARGARLG